MTPVFLAPAFHFQVPEGARQATAWVTCRPQTQDGGADGLVLYSLAASSPYFGINQDYRCPVPAGDSRAPGSGTGTSGGGRTRRRRHGAEAGGGGKGASARSRSATVPVTVDITHTALGPHLDLNLLWWELWRPLWESWWCFLPWQPLSWDCGPGQAAGGGAWPDVPGGTSG